MIILAVDTTSEWASVAVLKQGALLSETHLHSTSGFGHLIFAAIAEALSNASIPLNDVDCFAAASGPGSFTGVRVALAAVKGLAEARKKPAAGVSNLRALASVGSGQNRAVILDARRGQVFAAVYDAELRLVVSESVSRLDAWVQEHAGVVDEWITPAALRTAVPDTARWTEAPVYLAPCVALCAERDAAQDTLSDPASLDANYVRQADAQLFWKDR